MALLSRYFNWLQKDVPTGAVEKYPVTDNKGETSVKGIYIVGDLTGIPLLKMASESGKEIIDHLITDNKFIKDKSSKSDINAYDIVIVGAGPSGIAAAIEAEKNNLKYIVLESVKKFNTIINFPKGKPIYAEPENILQKSDLTITDGTKESLLDDLEMQINSRKLNIREGIEVIKIFKKNDLFEILTDSDEVFKSVRVVLAMGKSGNSRSLNIPGEHLTKVYNRLFDPADAEGHKVLVIGGGDSAIETAFAVTEYAESVHLSYRKSEFVRPKEGNIEKLKEKVDSGKITLLMNTDVKEIKEEGVILSGEEDKEIVIENSIVYTMIGKELPVAFFKRNNIRMEGDISLTGKLQFLLLLLISGVIYFGKSSAAFYKELAGQADNWNEVLQNVFTLTFLGKFIALPITLLDTLFSESIRVWNVTRYLNASIAYICFVASVFLGIYLLIKFIREHYSSLKLNWRTFKYAYFIVTGSFFVFVFFGEKYFGLKLFGESQSFYYTGLYSLTVLIFGLRRMYLKPTKYIKLQTWTLILIQVFPLFILPEFIFPWLGSIGALGVKDGFILTQVFPNESYWRSYGFILAWPLNFGNLYPYGNSISAFWLLFSILQTFVFIPLIVYKWGKGAYCGWICSCGALAETLGDEYRTLAPHSSKAKKWENFGQWALLAAFLITGLKLTAILFNYQIPLINVNLSYTAQFLQKIYYLGIDVIFAGVLGVGVYFFLSGRVWCRFGCPLAALMHIYTRFTKYRIFSDKKKCISCNICTKVCHMGIDVMNYANKGIPMNDVECVRCSACVVNCPTEVLYFGSLPESDVDNKYYKHYSIKLPDKRNWRSGMSV